MDKYIWFDYLDLLAYFNKDLKNPKVICPQNLKEEHDILVRKKRKIQELQKMEEKKKQIAEHEEIYKNKKQKFFGVQFTDGQIEIKVLESVKEIMIEGDVMHHCVFTNEYHLKPDSLILSASIENKKIETIEILLSKMEVIQCRGVCNKNSEYHDKIIKLVENNISLIKKRMVA